MKKLLLLSFAALGFAANSQSLLTEDCTLLTVGDVGTDLTGATDGQGGWKIFGPAGTPLSDMAVVDMLGTYGNAFQLTGSATATGTRYIYNETIADTWAAREDGNEIAEVTYDFFTGPVSTSKNTQRLTLFDPTGSKFLGGIMVTMDTKVISGLSYYNNAGTPGNYSLHGSNSCNTNCFTSRYVVQNRFSYNKTTEK